MPLTYAKSGRWRCGAMEVFRGIYVVLQIELLAAIAIEACRLL